MKGPFWIVLYNDDRNSFNVLGPVSSDAKTTSLTAELQTYGFNIHMEAASVAGISKEQLIDSIKQKLQKQLDSRINWLKDK